MRGRCIALGISLLLGLQLQARAAEGLYAGDMDRIRQTYRDRPLVVHVWSLTCAPCIAEFPLWAQRIKAHPEVAFVFVSTDGMRQSAPLDRRLAMAGVRPTRSLTYADDFVERLQFDIGEQWHGELPRTELRSPKGPVVVHMGPTSDVQFRKWVGSLGRASGAKLQ